MNRPSRSEPSHSTAERPELLANDPWLAECGIVETTLLLPTEQFRSLEAAASRRQMSVGRLVRELIRLTLTPSADRRQGMTAGEWSQIDEPARGPHHCA